MALREFTGDDARRWTAWDVYPRANYISPPDISPAVVTEQAQRGWLAFECSQTGERRRLFGVPPEWSTATDQELRQLCQEADPVPPRRRRLIE